MTEQLYNSVLEYGAIKDYSLPPSDSVPWMFSTTDFENILQKLSHPFGYHAPTMAHYRIHLYPSHIDDCKLLERIGAEEFTHSTEWETKTRPTDILKEGEDRGSYEFYYSKSCTNDNLIIFKLKCIRKPKYIGDTVEDFSARLCREQEWRDSDHIIYSSTNVKKYLDSLSPVDVKNYLDSLK